MARDVNGNYSLPSGNPVVTNTLIASTWANTTMSDIATALSNSLDRTGASAGMTGQLKGSDGAIGAPGYSFNSEPASGLYRAGAADLRFSIAAADVLRIQSTGITITGNATGTFLGVNGAVNTPSFSWSSEPTSGLYRNAANDLRFSVAGVDLLRFGPSVFTITAAAAPSEVFFDPSQGADAKNWRLITSGSSLFVDTRTDAGGAGRTALEIDRTGVAVTNVKLGNATDNTLYTFLGTGVSTFNGDITLSSTTINRLSFNNPGASFLVGMRGTAAVNNSLEFGRLSNSTTWGATYFRVNSDTSVDVADSAGTMWNVGFRDAPINVQNASYGFVISDRGKLVAFNGAAGQTYTVPANASVAYPVGTVLLVSNISGSNLSIAITTDTMFLSGVGSVGTRTLNSPSICAITKVTATQWVISGAGVS